MKQFGLLGENIQYSMSPALHRYIFQLYNIKAAYQLYDLPAYPSNLRQHLNHLDGFNVTIPYKEAILPFLDGLDESAQEIGAVNTVVNRSGKWIGYNTDIDGFCYTLSQIKSSPIKTACILGTGGASKMAQVALGALGIECQVLSRHETPSVTTYAAFENDRRSIDLLINCTPVGSQQIKDKMPIEASLIARFKVVYDMIYSPFETLLLASAREKGIEVVNGVTMLIVQALKADALWLDLNLDVDDLVPKMRKMFK